MKPKSKTFSVFRKKRKNEDNFTKALKKSVAWQIEMQEFLETIKNSEQGLISLLANKELKKEKKKRFLDFDEEF
jgi:hypothetical protein